MLPERKPDDHYFDHGTYWCRCSQELYDAAVAEPSNRQLRLDLAHVETRRELAYEKAREAWLREQEREAADEWLEETCYTEEVLRVKC